MHPPPIAPPFDEYPARCGKRPCVLSGTPNLPTNIVAFRGFDSSTILNLRGEIPGGTEHGNGQLNVNIMDMEYKCYIK